MNSIPVRKLFWEELELALETQTHRLVRDIANVLGQPADPLLKALKDDRVGVYLYDEPADQDIELSEMRCKELTVICGGNFVATCNNPVIWSPNPQLRRVCIHHAVQTAPLDTAGLPHVLSCNIGKMTYYVSVENGSVFDEEGTLVGRYVDDVVQLFHVDTE